MMRTRATSRYIPARYDVTIERPDLNAVVYASSLAVKGRVYAIGYSGKRMKHDFHFAFPNEQKRKEYIDRYFADIARSIEAKAKRKQERKEYVHDVPVGAIVINSWGYEQTNIDAYQVVATTEKTVTLREIAIESVPGSEYQHGMADMVVPVKDAFVSDETFRKPVRRGNHCASIIPFEFGCGLIWDGKPTYRSWYG